MKVSFFWFRRDLRLEDNTALFEALSCKEAVLPVFIFDDDILAELPPDDPRVRFIYSKIAHIDSVLKENESSLLCLNGAVIEVWKDLIEKYAIDTVFVNKDYEPYAKERDIRVGQLLEANGIRFSEFKDQVIHEEAEVVKNDKTPYTVFTPYKNRWMQLFSVVKIKPDISFQNFHRKHYSFPSREELGIRHSAITVKDYNLNSLGDYEQARNFPNLDSTSYLGPHLRFGTVSIRQVISQIEANEVFLSELIWREFFMQIIFHFPHVVTSNFRPKYDGIAWLNNQSDFEKWCQGNTGYPMVDAGMRQLNSTGYMHNRVRMVTAGFLCKHLLIDWRWGEAYFAQKLLDYELSSNNGNWQWAAGTGCDAAPYFRIFNPIEQLKKFDKNHHYIKKWIPELESDKYPKPMVDHPMARKRALERYGSAIS